MRSVWVFMGFAVVLCLIGAGSRFLDQSKDDEHRKEIDELKAEQTKRLGDTQAELTKYQEWHDTVARRNRTFLKEVEQLPLAARAVVGPLAEQFQTKPLRPVD